MVDIEGVHLRRWIKMNEEILKKIIYKIKELDSADKHAWKEAQDNWRDFRREVFGMLSEWDSSYKKKFKPCWVELLLF